MSRESTRALPHSEESEMAVLAAVLLMPECLPVVRGRLKPGDFYLERHQLIFASMIEIVDDGEEVDLRTLQGKLELRNAYETVGGMAYLAGLDQHLPDLGRIESYVEIVKERSVRRRLIQYAQSIAFDSSEGGKDAQEVLAEAEASIRELRGESQQVKARPRYEIYEDIIVGIEEAADRPRGITTGFDGFDLRTGGLRSELVIFGGGTGIGKSIWGRQIAEHVARAHGPCHYWSGEMDDTALELRAIAAGADVPHQKLRLGDVSADQMERVADYMRATGELPLLIMDKPGFDIADVEAAASVAGDLSAVFVDYLTLMGPPAGRFDSKRLEVAETTRRLKALSSALGIPVVVMAQLNRESASRPPWEPEVHHLAESASIERDADLVALLYPRLIDPDLEEYSEWKARSPRETWLKVAKHRNSVDGYRIALNLIPDFVRFEPSYDSKW